MGRYFRRRYGRKRLRGRRRFGRRLRRRMGSKRFKNSVKRILSSTAENKYVGWELPSTSFASIPNTWVEQLLTPVGQGLNYNQYIGASYYIKKIYFYGFLQGGQTGTVADESNNIVRIVIAIWDQDAGATPLATTTTGRNAQIYRGDYENLRRKLYDRTISLVSPSPEQGDGQIAARKKIRFYKKFKGLGFKMQVSRTTSQYKSRFIMSAISDSSAVPNPGFVTGHLKIIYKDY